MTVGLHAAGLWDCLQARDTAGTRGREGGFGEKAPQRSPRGQRPRPELLLAVRSYRTRPEPLGRGAEEILPGHWRQTENRARTAGWSWKVVGSRLSGAGLSQVMPLPRVCPEGSLVPHAPSALRPVASLTTASGWGIRPGGERGQTWAGMGAALPFPGQEDRVPITLPRLD